MPNYRRAFVEGATWFFTVNLLDRRSRLLVERIDALHGAVSAVQQRFPFEIDAMVVLPDHLHAIWTLPRDDADFSVRWNQFKVRFSKSIPYGEASTSSRKSRGERGLWQRRFWEHLIRDERDFDAHIDYCWFNPVKHGLVRRVEDWPHSTFHRDYKELPSLEEFERRLQEHAKHNYGEPN